MKSQKRSRKVTALYEDYEEIIRVKELFWKTGVSTFFSLFLFLFFIFGELYGMILFNHTKCFQS